MAVPLFVVAGVTVTAAHVAQVAVVLYGIYRARQQKKRLEKAARDNLEDQTVSIPSSAMVRTVHYGTTMIHGRVALLVGANDAQPHFFMVVALTPNHMLDRIDEIYLDGIPIGPFGGSSWWTDEGSWAAIGSRFVKRQLRTERFAGPIPPSGVVICKGNIENLTTVAVGDAPPDPATPRYGWEDMPGATSADYGGFRESSSLGLGAPVISGRELRFPTAYAGRTAIFTYTWVEHLSHIRAWCRPGSDTQTAIPRISEVFPQWNANCRLRGIPYVALEIVPDMDLFPNGAPTDVTVRARGKRIWDPRKPAGAQMAYSENPAIIAMDILLTSRFGCTVDEINMTRLLSAANACEESVPTGPTSAEARYACHASFETSEAPVNWLQLTLAAMAGSATYSAAQFDVRAGVAQTPFGDLSDNDLASGAWSVKPFKAITESFNSVRGLYTKYDTETQQFVVTDAPPYSSPTYVAQDSGLVAWEQIDLPTVQSVGQVQRIQKLLLHLNRNALEFLATFKMKAHAYSPGEIILLSMRSLGWESKPFMVTTRRVEEANDVVTLGFVEHAPDVYSWTFDEATAPDPAPNTNLPDPTFVPPITGFKAESGPGIGRFGPNAEFVPTMRMTWDRVADMGVRTSGHIEILYRGAFDAEMRQEMKPGDAQRFDVDILRGQQFHIQIRAINSLTFKGPWFVTSHTTSDALTGHLTGNLLPGAQFDPSSSTDSQVLGWTHVERVGGSVEPRVILSGVRPSQSYRDDIGVAQFSGISLLSGPNAVGMQFRAFSAAVLVDEGQRLVQYVSSATSGARSWSVLAFYDANNGLVAWGGSSDGYGLNMGDPHNPDLDWSQPLRKRMNIISGFATVPPGAVSVRMVLVAELTSHATGANNAYWFRPFLGNASEGQVTLPPWSP